MSKRTTYSNKSSAGGKSSKSSFGFLWIPGKRKHGSHHHKKDKFYNPVRNEAGHHSLHQPLHQHFPNMETGDAQASPLVEGREPHHLPPKILVPVAVNSLPAVDKPSVIDDVTPEGTTAEKSSLVTEKSAETLRIDMKESLDKDDYLENKVEEYKDGDETVKIHSKKHVGKTDKTDGVYLRGPPAGKRRTYNVNEEPEEEECMIKCLYYSMQCCDCSIM